MKQIPMYYENRVIALIPTEHVRKCIAVSRNTTMTTWFILGQLVSYESVPGESWAIYDGPLTITHLKGSKDFIAQLIIALRIRRHFFSVAFGRFKLKVTHDTLPPHQ